MPERSCVNGRLTAFARQLEEAERVAICLDFDGTLAPISTDPAEVTLGGEEREILRRVGSTAGVTGAIISGRALEDVRSRVGVDTLHYAGNHGLVILRDRGRWVHPAVRRSRSGMEEIVRRLELELSTIDGAFVEDKFATLSVHYRTASPEDVSRVRAVVERCVRSTALRTAPGKAVIQIRPNTDWDKGDAVRVLAKPSWRSFTLFAGDDRTDVDAFRMLKRLPGESVAIGVGDSSLPADIHLQHPPEVYDMLEEVLSYRSRPI